MLQEYGEFEPEAEGEAASTPPEQGTPKTRRRKAGTAKTVKSRTRGAKPKPSRAKAETEGEVARETGAPKRKRPARAKRAAVPAAPPVALSPPAAVAAHTPEEHPTEAHAFDTLVPVEPTPSERPPAAPLAAPPRVGTPALRAAALGVILLGGGLVAWHETGRSAPPAAVAAVRLADPEATRVLARAEASTSAATSPELGVPAATPAPEATPRPVILAALSPTAPVAAAPVPAPEPEAIAPFAAAGTPVPALAAPLPPRRPGGLVGRPVTTAARPASPPAGATPAIASASAEEEAEPYDQFVRREHQPGSYRLRWGVARLDDDGRSESARGATWAFRAGTPTGTP